MALKERSGPLTAALVRSVKVPGKYHDGKSTGLYLRVEQNGSRFWVQRTTVNGKRREIGLGSPPIVSLVNARKEAEENKRLIRRGEDPLAQKRIRLVVYVYSKEPYQFERKFQGFDSWLPAVGQRAQGAKENRQLLEETVAFLKKKRRPRDPVRQMIRDQPFEAQAAILAYFSLDAKRKST